MQSQDDGCLFWRREWQACCFFLLLLWIVAAMLPSVRAQGALRFASQAQQGTAPLENFDRQLGPFEIQKQQFTVVLHSKRIAGSTEADFGETLARLEIKDAGGTVHYQKTFPYEVEGDRFFETTDASAQLLQGKQGSGLLVTYGTLPSTPLGGSSYQVFGLFSGPPSAPLIGKLVPFSKPIFAEGQLLEEKPGEKVVQTSEEPKLQGDVLHFRVWTGNFFVIIPLRILWFQNTMGLAWRCQKMKPRGPQRLCELRVEANRAPQEDEMTFVRLHPEPEEEMGTADHVVVKKDSQVEFLAVEAETVWSEDAEGVGLSTAEDPWLKVRIDGKEGWIHTQEDFMAIGLPQAG